MKPNILNSRQSKYGAYSAVYVLVFLGILVAVNYLAAHYNKTFDATAEKLYSLSGQTLRVLDELENGVTIYYFDQKTRFQQAEDSLVRYENASSRVAVSYIDPDSKPEMARAMNIRTYGTVIVEVGAVREEASSTGEEDITNALIKALKGEEKTACLLTGHGEADPEDSGRDGFQLAKQEVEAANYQTKTVSLLENPEIPSDCTLLVVAGPQTGYLEPEAEILENYVESGGRVLFLVDYEKGQNLVNLLAGWGVKVNNDVVVDLSGIGQLFGGGPLTPLVADYESHPITQVMGSVATFFPMARSIEPGDAPQGWTVSRLFQTTSGAFATSNLDVQEGELVRHPDAETEGPINLAVAATYDVPDTGAASGDSSDEEAEGASEEPEADEDQQGRVVVVGTSLFARNNFLNRGGNLDLFLNMLNWLSSDEDLISIRPKDPANTPLDISQSQMSRLFWGTVVGLPLLIVIAGVRMWWVRR